MNDLSTRTNPSRKRRSNANDEDQSQSQLESAKRLRLTPQMSGEPHFEQLHPSFATTSFGSIPPPAGAQEQADFSHDTIDIQGIDDSGIGMGLLEDELGHDKKLALDKPQYVGEAAQMQRI